MTNKHVCEYCHGVIAAPRRLTLEQTVEHHLEACPAALRMPKKPKPVVQEPPRKRVIPRQVLDDS